MKTLDDLIKHLEASENFTLLSSDQGEMSSHEFLQQVKLREIELEKLLKNKSDKSIILNNENPLTFYPIVFAALKNNICICFPTKKFIGGEEQISFAKYILSLNEQGDLLLKDNVSFKDIKMPKQTEIIVFSSGSTGTPKGIAHINNNFVLNAISVHEVLNIKQYTSLTFLKPYLVSAYCHFLVHIISRSTLYFRDFSDTKAISELGALDPEIGVIGAPLHLVSILKAAPQNLNPKYFFSSGDFLHFSHSKLILELFPKTNIFKVYGLAELAGRFFIKKINKQTPEIEFDHIGENLDIHDFKLNDNQLFVKSKSLFFGYLKDNEFLPAEDYHPTGDLAGYGAGGLELQGRESDEYKVGGNKVGIKNLEKKISPLFPEDQVILVPTPNPLFGNLISFVIKTQNKYEKAEIVIKLRTVLKKYEIPHQFFYINDIPYGQSFKIDRSQIAEKIDNLVKIK